MPQPTWDDDDLGFPEAQTAFTGVADPREDEAGFVCGFLRAKDHGCPISRSSFARCGYHLAPPASFPPHWQRTLRFAFPTSRRVPHPSRFLRRVGYHEPSIPTLAYPTLCQERKGWGHPPFRGASCRVKHQPRGLIENLFLLRKRHSRPSLA